MQRTYYTDTETRELLRHLNDEKAVIVIPVMVFMACLMMMGIIGNSMVCFYYGKRTKTTSNSILICLLGFIDLFSCVFSIPFEIIDLRFFFDFTLTGACKFLRFMNYSAAIGSAFTLMLISIDRYNHISRPLKPQLTNKQTQFSCLAIAFITVLFSWPAIVAFKPEAVEVQNDYGINITGHDCTTDRSASFRVYMWIFNGVYMIFYVVTAIVVFTMYSFVAVALYRQTKFRKKYIRTGSKTLKEESKIEAYDSERVAVNNNIELNEMKLRGSCSLSSTVGKIIPRRKYNSEGIRNTQEIDDVQLTNIRSNKFVSIRNKSQQLETGKPEEIRQHIDEGAQHETMGIVAIENIRPSTHISTVITIGTSKNIQTHERETIQADSIPKSPSSNSIGDTDATKRRSTGSERARVTISKIRQANIEIKNIKYTVMMFVITGVFLLSFVPHLSLVTWRSFVQYYEGESMSDAALIGFNIGIRSTFINAAVNPLIYGFFNTDFRRFFFRSCCLCCRL
ncbi:dopamine receptor 4-like [Mya arenaria]|uniref:dopamine receptor 4-like n=1 Tax=Mya arenaria TaxID=6604 RepID=UPI0022E2D5A9|nr:dopamine receptor 4-like [Mya arenaria]